MFETILEIASTAVKLLTTITGTATLIKETAKAVSKRRNKKMITLKHQGKTYHLKTIMRTYRTHENLYIGLVDDIEKYDRNEGAFCDLTVNICPLEDDTWACVNTHCSFAEELIKEYELGTPVGISIHSGSCQYPVYKFDLDKVKEHLYEA